MEKLNVNSIFYTFSGEIGSIPQGTPCLLIRLQGCNLHCPWCDAQDSIPKDGGSKIGVDILAEMILKTNFPTLITGGEPFLQIDGLQSLCKLVSEKYRGRKIQIETNGLFDEYYAKVREYASIIADYKLAFADSYSERCFDQLEKHDFLKIVVNAGAQIGMLPDVVNKIYTSIPSGDAPRLAVTSVDKELYPAICDAILKDKLPLTVNVQLHKILKVE
jgi:7-carboxy-7-deazaguanine synthase